MNFTIERLSNPDLVLVRPRRFADGRGWFTETYRADAFVQLGITATFVQDNQSLSESAGTLRGLHFQAPPRAQAKLVRAVRGALFDVAVDLRRGSPTFGKWVGVELTAASGEQLFVPAGFAHGFCTLVPSTEVAYKCDAYYAPEYEGGIAAIDPELGIVWPFPAQEMIVSDKDRALPHLRELTSPFQFERGEGEAK